MDEINDLLSKLSRYISDDIANVELEHSPHHRFFDVLKHSMNIPMYYYCMSVLGSALAQVDTEIDETDIANWLDSDRLMHSSIEDEYKESSRIFKRSLNVSAFQYLINYRIERVKFLLEKTDYTVYMIAERCGFHDAHHSAKIFKKQTGYTPTEF